MLDVYLTFSHNPKFRFNRHLKPYSELDACGDICVLLDFV